MAVVLRRDHSDCTTRSHGTFKPKSRFSAPVTLYRPEKAVGCHKAKAKTPGFHINQARGLKAGLYLENIGGFQGWKVTMKMEAAPREEAGAVKTLKTAEADHQIHHRPHQSDRQMHHRPRHRPRRRHRPHRRPGHPRCHQARRRTSHPSLRLVGRRPHHRPHHHLLRRDRRDRQERLVLRRCPHQVAQRTHARGQRKTRSFRERPFQEALPACHRQGPHRKRPNTARERPRAKHEFIPKWPRDRPLEKRKNSPRGDKQNKNKHGPNREGSASVKECPLTPVQENGRARKWTSAATNGPRTVCRSQRPRNKKPGSERPQQLTSRKQPLCPEWPPSVKTRRS